MLSRRAEHEGRGFKVNNVKSVSSNIRRCAALSLGVACCATHASAAIVQVGPDFSFNGSSYALLSADLTDSVNDLQAFAVANFFGGNLVTINDQAEHDFVVNTFAPLANGAGDAALFIGLQNDPPGSGTGEWFDGTPFDLSSFEAWGAGEPNNGSGNEPFTFIADIDGLTGAWIDSGDIPTVASQFQTLGIQAFGIVEFIPTPGTAGVLAIAGLAAARRRR